MIHITNKSEQKGQQLVKQTGSPKSTFTMTNDSTDLLLSASIIDAYASDVAIF